MRKEDKKKAKVAFLVFIIATLGKLFDGKGPFGDNVIKNLARYACIPKQISTS